MPPQIYPSLIMGQMCEAKFLIGVLAGVMTILDKEEEREIGGYIADYDLRRVTNINAFALGVKMVSKAKFIWRWYAQGKMNILILTASYIPWVQHAP
ncbi:MAG: hypothetical protein ACLUD0_01430 [Eubacterium ramulus]